MARQPIKTVAAVGITIALLILLSVSGWLRPVEHWVGLTVQPAWHVLYTIVDSISPLWRTTDNVLLAENTNLKDLLTKVVRENHSLQTQLIQYQQYQEELAFARQNDYDILPAKIISRLGQKNNSQLLLINRGSSHGLKVGYPIIYGTGALLGTVSTVHDTSAEVTLLTHSTSQWQGMVAGSSPPTAGIVRGQFDTSLIFEYVLKEQALTVGDVIVTNGQDQFIPAGLVMGIVATVSAAPSELFQSATVTPLQRYGNNAIVSVIIPK